MTPEAPSTSFAKDNTSGILPEVLATISDVNSGPAIGYGDDPYTEKAREQMNALFKRGYYSLGLWRDRCECCRFAGNAKTMGSRYLYQIIAYKYR